MSQSYRFDRVEVRPAERALLIDGARAELGSRAFDVLQALIKHRDRVVTKDELLDMVWPGLVVEENNLQAQVSTLRKLLGPKAIATIPGRGYQFSLAETALPESPATAIPSVVAPAINHNPQHVERGDHQQALVKSAPTTLTDAERAAVLGGTLPWPAARVSAQSIAVLPFTNLTGDANDEYFADGLAEELLNVLAKIKGLRVAARTSAFSFKGKSDDIASIGQKLSVASVLEGSVRKSGSRMRVSVQLVKVDDGFQIWSETYDRTLDDIFAVQDDIAQSVVKGLRATLLGATGSSSPSNNSNNRQQVADEIAHATQARSHNPEAQRLVMQARFYALRRRPDDIERGIILCGQAIDLDRDYAGAYTNLSQAWLFAAFYSGPKSLVGKHVMACFGHARAAAETALRLDATDPMPHVVFSFIAWIGDHDVVTCMRELTTAHTLAPENAEVLRNMGHRHMSLGHFDDARKFLDKGIALDPLAIMLRLNRLMLARFMGHAREALQWGLAAVEIEPSSWFAQFDLGVAYCDMGDYANAVKCRALAEELRGDAATATALREEFALDGWRGFLRASIREPKSAVARYELAVAHAALGEFDHALSVLDQIVDNHGQYIDRLKIDPSLAPLHGDPRYAALLKRAGFPE